MNVELRDYQKRIVKEECMRPNLLVVAPMGAGKTLSTLFATSALISTKASSPDTHTGGVKNVLIIAPKRVAKSVWAQEAAEYELGLNVRFCERAIDIKLFLVEPANHRICVCSVTRIHEIPHGCWDMVIIDESTLFGNKKSLRSKEVRRICNKVPRRILLTGTPIHGGYEKLWHQIFLLDGGAALGKTLTAFRQKYMRVKYQMNGVVTVWEINPVMIPQLHKDIAHLVYVVKESVALPLILYKNVYVNMPAKRVKEYGEFERESILEFSEGNPYTGETKKLVAFAASARGIKLRQLASGCVYTDETGKLYSVTHTEKIEAVKEIVECAERGVLVAYSFRSEYEELRKAFPTARRLETAEDIADWNAGRIDVVLAHPASVGHGLNLQRGGCVVVWFSLTYDAELYAQFNKRLHRPGQQDTVSVIHLVTRGTIDEKVLRVLQMKQDRADGFNQIG